MSEQNTPRRERGYYWVKFHSTEGFFLAMYTGSRWSVQDEDGHPWFYKDAHLEVIDENRLTYGCEHEYPENTYGGTSAPRCMKCGSPATSMLPTVKIRSLNTPNQ